jgi:membrane protease subunit HflK
MSGGATAIGWLILLALGGWYAASGIFQVGPQEVGLVKQFGKFVGQPKEPGLHYRLPWPFQSVTVINVSQVRKIEIGFRTITPPPNPRYQDYPEESLMLTGDNNIVKAEAAIQYQVSSPVQFAFNVSAMNAEVIVRQAAESILREAVADQKIDEVLTTQRDIIALTVAEGIQKVLDTYDLGFKIINVALQDVTPPTEVKAAFDDVNSARQDKERLVNEAERYRNDIVPKAQGLAQEILNQAEAYKQTRVKIAEGDVARFLDILQRYKKEGADVTKIRLYLETMEEILPKLQKIIMTKGTGGGTVQYLDLESLLKAAREKK